ncbi:hypothetical protein ISCGN_008278 [Ixodes scapularis]
MFCEACCNLLHKMMYLEVGSVKPCSELQREPKGAVSYIRPTFRIKKKKKKQCGMAKKTLFLCKARQIMRRWRKRAFCIKSLFQTLFVRIPPIEKACGKRLSTHLVSLRQCSSAAKTCFHRLHYGNERRMGKRVNTLACVRAASR